MGFKTGVDIIEIDRIKNALSKTPNAFLNKVYTLREIDYCESKNRARMESYAARFCAKEAVSKALGTGISRGISFQDIEVVNNQDGKPEVFLYKEAASIFAALGGKSIEISLSHCREYAAAFAVIETTGEECK